MCPPGSPAPSWTHELWPIHSCAGGGGFGFGCGQRCPAAADSECADLSSDGRGLGGAGRPLWMARAAAKCRGGGCLRGRFFAVLPGPRHGRRRREVGGCSWLHCGSPPSCKRDDRHCICGRDFGNLVDAGVSAHHADDTEHVVRGWVSRSARLAGAPGRQLRQPRLGTNAVWIGVRSGYTLLGSVFAVVEVIYG